MVALTDGDDSAARRRAVRRGGSDEAEDLEDLGRSAVSAGVDEGEEGRGRTTALCSSSESVEHRLRSLSPSVEFLPEDREWLAEVLLKPLGTVQLAGLGQPEQVRLFERLLIQLADHGKAGTAKRVAAPSAAAWRCFCVGTASEYTYHFTTPLSLTALWVASQLQGLQHPLSPTVVEDVRSMMTTVSA
jgi:hypothetical protein